MPGREISAIAARTRSAISSAASISVSGSRTANSSPPLRPAKSLARSTPRSVAPTFAQHLVPHRVPALVVDLLEVVEVEQEQGERRLVVAACANVRFSASVTARLLGSPVSPSVAARISATARLRRLARTGAAWPTDSRIRCSSASE